MKSLRVHAGPRAIAHLRQHGLLPEGIAAIAAAAGGPKGLIFKHLDQWLFGSWLPAAPRSRQLVGASIGAWRMAAACQPDPVAAFERLTDLYCEQRYGKNPSAAKVTAVAARILEQFVGGNETALLLHPHHRLQVLTTRGAGLLSAPRRNAHAMAGFATALAANLLSRRWLSHHMQRLVLVDPREPANWLRQPFDAFDTGFAPLRGHNLRAALLASGTLPLVMEPVRQIPDAPPGTYWDGGLIDYHLALPWSRIDDGLVLYPHFSEHIVPGWFDKPLRWRRAASGRQKHWLDNLVLLSPSAEFLRALPLGKLPDRNDFHHYGTDHERRIRDWKQAIAQGQRLRDELEEFVRRPDMSQVTMI